MPIESHKGIAFWVFVIEIAVQGIIFPMIDMFEIEGSAGSVTAL